MPEIVKKPNGEIDYQKIFMGLAVAVVFVMQQWHAMKLADVQATIVPRAEFERKADKVMDRDDILAALKRLGDRMDAIEDKR